MQKPCDVDQRKSGAKVTTKIKEEKKIVQIKDKGADSCDETESDSEAEGGRWNPYTEFLQNIEDEDSEDEEVFFQTFTSFII